MRRPTALRSPTSARRPGGASCRSRVEDAARAARHRGRRQARRRRSTHRRATPARAPPRPSGRRRGRRAATRGCSRAGSCFHRLVERRLDPDAAVTPARASTRSAGARTRPGAARCPAGEHVGELAERVGLSTSRSVAPRGRARPWRRAARDELQHASLTLSRSRRKRAVAAQRPARPPAASQSGWRSTRPRAGPRIAGERADGGRLSRCDEGTSESPAATSRPGRTPSARTPTSASDGEHDRAAAHAAKRRARRRGRSPRPRRSRSPRASPAAGPEQRARNAPVSRISPAPRRAASWLRPPALGRHGLARAARLDEARREPGEQVATPSATRSRLGSTW